MNVQAAPLVGPSSRLVTPFTMPIPATCGWPVRFGLFPCPGRGEKVSQRVILFFMRQVIQAVFDLFWLGDEGISSENSIPDRKYIAVVRIRFFVDFRMMNFVSA